MAYNFLRGGRDQPFLLPPDLRDWLPADHLAWFVLDVVDQLNLEPFLRAYRADGHGHPAYDPKLLLGVLLYAYAIGVRSSRHRSSGAAPRTSPSACWPATRPPTT
jgi:transposase